MADGSQLQSQDSATLNSLPSWYTNYAQSITNSGMGALNNINNYKGAVDQNGNPLPRVAGFTPMQNQAAAQAQANQGNWVPDVNSGFGLTQQGAGAINGAGGTFNSALGQAHTANGTYGSAINTINGSGNNFNQAQNTINGASGNFDQGAGMVSGASTAFGNAGNGFGTSAGTLANGAIPTINNGTGYLNSGGGALGQASNTLAPASGMAANGAGTIMDQGNQAERNAWMNPYTGAMAQRIAQLSNQNLMENVIPNINSTFVGNGQFGSTRDGTFMNRALRDNQLTINDANAQMLLQAQNQADSQYAAEKQRQLQGAQTMGGLAQVGTGIGNAYGNLGAVNTAMGNALTSAAQAQTNNAIGQTNLGTAQVNQGNTMAQIGNDRVTQGNALTNVGIGRVDAGNALNNAAMGQNQVANVMNSIGANQVGMGQALGNLGVQQGQLGQMRSALGINDVNQLLGIGSMQQQTNQAGLNASLADFQDRRDYPLQALGALSQILPNVSSRVYPDTQSSQVTGIPNMNDPYQNLSGIADIIRGMSANSSNT